MILRTKVDCHVGEAIRTEGDILRLVDMLVPENNRTES